MHQDHLLPVILSNAVREVLPRLRVHAFLFHGARIGVGHSGLDPLRRRVVARVDEAVDRHGHVDAIPNIEAIAELLEALGQDPRRHPATLREQVSAMAERRPFPVQNDAVDTGFLLSLYYFSPVFVLDAGALRPPLQLLPSPEDMVIPTPEGPLQTKGALVLADEEKVLRSVQNPIRRAREIAPTRDLLFVLIDPGAEGGIDPARTRDRIENWVSTLTRAALVRSTTTPSKPD